MRCCSGGTGTRLKPGRCLQTSQVTSKKLLNVPFQTHTTTHYFLGVFPPVDDMGLVVEYGNYILAALVFGIVIRIVSGPRKAIRRNGEPLR